MKTLIHLAYVSQAVSSLDETTVADIAVKAARKNATLGVGGFLYLQNRSIFQVLEGDADIVRALFARIMTDPRHHTVIQIRDQAATCRRFLRWGMTRLTSCPRILSRGLGCDLADPAHCLANRCHEKDGFVDRIIAAGALIHDMAVAPGMEILSMPGDGPS